MPGDRRAGRRRTVSLHTVLIVLVAVCLLAVVVVARVRNVYPVTGTLASEGDGLDNWRSRPDACSTDPQDGQPPERSQTALVLNWFDVTLDDPIRNWAHWLTVDDVPLRLDIERTPDGLSAALTTAKTDDALVLEGKACRVLRLDTRPGAPLVRGAKASLTGTLDLDCSVGDRHITGHLEFDRCGL